MKKSLNINATRNGKKVSKSLGYVNPDVANSLVGGFAQMVNALSNDTFVNAEVVKKMDTTEEDTGGGSTPAPAGKQEGIITLTTDDNGYTYTVDYNGDGQLFIVAGADAVKNPPGTLSGNTLTVHTMGATHIPGTGYVVALATDNFTAAIASFHEQVN